MIAQEVLIIILFYIMITIKLPSWFTGGAGAFKI